MEIIKNRKNRIEIIDVIRGMALIFMIIYHFLFDLSFFIGLRIDIYSFEVAIFQIIAAYTFVTISGVSSLLSRNNIKQGIKLILIGMVITIASFFFAPDDPIYFGTLHFIGVAKILYGLFGKYINKINCIVGIVSSLLLFSITKQILYNIVIDTPHLYILGLMDNNFSSLDYFPIFPWIFLFLFGVFLFSSIKDKLPEKIGKIKVPVISFIGRNTLIFYLIHQPILLGLLYLFTLI